MAGKTWTGRELEAIECRNCSYTNGYTGYDGLLRCAHCCSLVLVEGADGVMQAVRA